MLNVMAHTAIVGKGQVVLSKTKHIATLCPSNPTPRSQSCGLPPHYTDRVIGSER